MIAGLTYYQIAMYFLIYSIVGWAIEVVFCAVTLGKVLNRGFLNGPVCPIYGFGMIAILMIIKSFVPGAVSEYNTFAVFLGCALLATLVELIGGFLMLKLFHARWWDYSDKPFNFHGFICPEFSIMWGIGGVIVIKLAHPMIANMSADRIPAHYGWPILGVFYLVYLVDTIVTVVTVNGLNKDLKEIEKIGKSIEKVSDAISEQLGTTAIMTDRVITEGRIQYTLGKAEAKDALANTTAGARDALANTTAGAKEAIVNTTSEAKDSLVNKALQVMEAYSNGKDAAAGAVASAKKKAQEAYADSKTRKMKEELTCRSDYLKNDILKKTHFGGGRLLKAFPDMVHTDYKDLIKELQAKLNGSKDDNNKDKE